MPLSVIGNFLQSLALLCSLLCFCLGLYGASKNRYNIIELSRLASFGAFFCATFAILILGFAFLKNDYSIHYVWQFSNRDMPSIYKVAAIWGGMNGSMLFWAFLLSLWGAVIAINFNRYPREIISRAIPWHASATFFFLITTVFLSNPFAFIKADFVPPDGNGLNPLLQNPYMALHPPLLYLGFTAFAVPFALCIAALFSRSLSDDWIQITRRWALFAWGFLTAGIVLGGFWAYLELGWGGFWAWDPVENSSFLPWLTATAFIHSIMIQERKGMARGWNVFLIGLTYFLTIFGTFLTRSGIVQSIHAFASAEVGEIFLFYMSFIALLCGYLLITRSSELKSKRGLESFLSREAAFLVNNLIFLSIMFAIIWGVMFPVLSEAVTGTKQTIGIPFFNAVTSPLFMMMLFLMGVGTLISWKKASLESLRKTFLFPFVFSLVLAATLVWAGITSFYPVLSYSLCFFVLLTLIGEWHRGVKSQGLSSDTAGGIATATGKLFRRHTRRYGGYLVHFGVLVVTVSITASMAHKVEREFSLSKGESLSIGRFKVELSDIYGQRTPNHEALVAKVNVYTSKDNRFYADLTPELRYYPSREETTTEVAIKSSPRDDIYIVLAGVDENDSRASFKLYINPLQMWLWVGAIIMSLGTIVVLIPNSARSTSLAKENVDGVVIS